MPYLSKSLPYILKMAVYWLYGYMVIWLYGYLVTLLHGYMKYGDKVTF